MASREIRSRLAAGLLLVALVAFLAPAPLRAYAAPAADPDVPVMGPPVAGTAVIVSPFDPPDQRWQAGHRGVDVAAAVGSDVLATAAGTVSFAGRIAGRPVLVIDHGGVRTTYEPVVAVVAVGTRVDTGDVVGRLEGGHDCGRPGTTCIHVGVKRGEDYLEPRFTVGSASRIRLLPADALAGIRQRAQERVEAAAAAAAAGPVDAGPAPPPGASGFVRPSAGAITSRFGMRRHPVLGVVKLHDGTDFGTGCGAPLRSIAPGRVTQSYFNAGYGNRLLIDHGVVRGRRVVSSYNHAIRYSVAPGQQVAAGQVVGLSGTTGYSTGCHLHFMMWVDGQLVNPEQWL